MKLWIRHENRFGLVRVGNCIAFSKEEAIKLADANNKYCTSPSSIEFTALNVQEVEIDSDYIIYLLMNNNNFHDWRSSLLKMIDDEKNSQIKFGEIVPIEQVTPIVLA